MFLKSLKPKADMGNNRLILTLPDAVTPVVWVFDMEQEKTFTLKVEQSDDGYFILQKLSQKGQSDDIAYYENQDQALRAMMVMNNTLNNSDDNDRNMGNNGFSIVTKIIRLIALCLFVIFVLFLGYLLYQPAKIIIMNFLNGNNQVTQTTNTPNPIPSPVEQDTSAMGVPLSADDFLKENNSLPF